MPRPKGSKNKVKTTKVTADFAAQIAAKQEEKAAVEAEILKVAASIEELNTDVKSLNADLKAKKAVCQEARQRSSQAGSQAGRCRPESRRGIQEGRSRGCAEKAPRQRCERRRNS